MNDNLPFYPSASSGEPLQIAAKESFPHKLAQLILQAHQTSLPDLSHIHILIPNALAGQQLRYAFSQQCNALLGPIIDNLPHWLQSHSLIPSGRQRINQASRQLLLLEALKQYPSLFNPGNIWQVCNSLLGLFDELSHYARPLMDTSDSQWQNQLQQAYGAEHELHYLSQEARLVHSLWHAWQQQMEAMNLIDDAAHYQMSLSQPIDQLAENSCFYVVNNDDLSEAELAFYKNLASHYPVTFISQIPHTSSPEKNSLDYFLQQTYNHQQSLKSRSQNVDFDSERITRHLKLFSACSHEQEAQAVSLQSRLYLLQAYQNIAIVTEDRKLARRVRAILEAYNIQVRDTAGWLLPTTSAATIIERWLECIEEDFAHQPMLDLLKSPFFCATENKDIHLQQVYRLEQDIIHYENIPQNLKRYQQALKFRRERLQHWHEKQFEAVGQLLEKLEQNAKELVELYQSANTYSADHYLSALLKSLHELGIEQLLEQDKAGQLILQNLKQMQQAIEYASPEMSWADFRIWLADTLEAQSFTPFNQQSPVQLMNMQQAQYCHFDALIIAAANKQSLPGSAKQSSFFNQQVRSALKLPHWQQQKQQSFELFKCLLQSANEVFITYTSENNGEYIAPSPWLSSLDVFAQQALKINLHDTAMPVMLKQLKAYQDTDQPPLPGQSRPPAVVLNEELIPETFSASRYQRLINCPYLFFAADSLKLRATEEIKETLQKSEYGEKVHHILHIFHQKVPGIKIENRQQAIEQLTAFSKKEFTKNLEDNVQHRGWLNRWLNIVPAYIDWQIERQQAWQIYKMEQQQTVAIDNKHSLFGRLDRIDRQQQQLSIIDYKTGAVASQHNINTGEDVQLSSYAMLMDNVQEVLYLSLDKGVKTAAHLANESLESLKQLNLQRLQILIESLEQGAALKAQGDEKVCNYCDMSGLCRKQSWEV